MKIYEETYGCPMNKAETNAVVNDFLNLGWTKTDDISQADLWFINTCSVRESAEERIFGRIGIFKNIKSTSKTKKVLVFSGCMANHYKDKIKKKFPFIDVVVSNEDKSNLAKIITSQFKGQTENKKLKITLDEFNKGDKYSFLKNHFTNGVMALIPIMNGCNNFCSYCIIPYVRGREVSRSNLEIIDELKKLGQTGVKAVTLLGQNVNSYNYNGIDFETLIKQIDSQDLGSIKWIYFDSPHPKDFKTDLIKTLSHLKHFPHFYHIPIQSGNTQILKDMNRHHTREDLINLFNQIKKQMSDVGFSTDIMVGFPGETEECYNDTMSIIEEIPFTECYMYYWNEREGTRAVSMPNQIDVSVRKARLEKLIDKQRTLQSKLKEKSFGSVEEVLVEHTSRDNDNEYFGKNSHLESVVFKSKRNDIKPNDIVKVKIQSLQGMTLYGEEVID